VPGSNAKDSRVAERRDIEARGDDALSIPLVQERAVILRREVETGRVRLHLRTEVEEVPVSADLRTETMEVERVPIGRELAVGEAAPAPREEEDGAVLVVPVLEEVLVVEKRLVLTEELRIRRRTAVETVESTIALRRQRAEVERLPPGAEAAHEGPGGWAEASKLPSTGEKE